MLVNPGSDDPEYRLSLPFCVLSDRVWQIARTWPRPLACRGESKSPSSPPQTLVYFPADCPTQGAPEADSR